MWGQPFRAPLVRAFQRGFYEPGGRMFESCRAHQPSLAVPTLPSRVLNNSDQFAADLVDGLAERSVEHLRVHVQRRIDVGVTHQLRDDFPRHTAVVRPRVGAPERQPRCSRKLQPLARRTTLFGRMGVPALVENISASGLTPPPRAAAVRFGVTSWEDRPRSIAHRSRSYRAGRQSSCVGVALALRKRVNSCGLLADRDSTHNML